MADAIDVECLAGATFLNDGQTVILRDGTIVHRRARIAQPWVEVLRGKKN